MRSLAFVLVTPLLACSANVSSNDPLTPDGPPASDDGGTVMPPPPPTFQKTTMIDIAPGEDSTHCFSFLMPNTDQLTIRRWASHMGEGVHDIVLYVTPTPQPNCIVAKSTGGIAWSYAAQTTDADFQFPGDDGSGKPIGQLIKASQPAFLQIHVVNKTTTTLHADVSLSAWAYPGNVQTTYAAPFMALSLDFTVKPGSTASPAMGMASGACTIPPDPTGPTGPTAKPVQFFGITTYTHKQGVHTLVKDGTSKIFESTNWEHPGTTSSSPFYTFQSGTLSYQCEYLNGNAYTIVSGDDVTRQEMCVAVGYFFPAPDGIGHYCVDSLMLL